MTMRDVPEALALWRSAKGIGLGDADTEVGIAAFLSRNPDLSLVAREDERLVGAVLCGHDGRRGYLHHLAVASPARRRGIGQALADRCLDALHRRGIGKCHLFVFDTNSEALAFWQRAGWQARLDLTIMSHPTKPASPRRP